MPYEAKTYRTWALANPEKIRENNRRFKENNPGYHNEKKREYKKRNYDYLAEVKESNPCSDCGTFYPRYVMEYHHPPGTKNGKRTEVTTLAAKGVSLKRLQEEIDKCVLVCSNCHRIRHYGEQANT